MGSSSTPKTSLSNFQTPPVTTSITQHIGFNKFSIEIALKLLVTTAVVSTYPSNRTKTIWSLLRFNVVVTGAIPTYMPSILTFAPVGSELIVTKSLVPVNKVPHEVVKISIAINNGKRKNDNINSPKYSNTTILTLIKNI